MWPSALVYQTEAGRYELRSAGPRRPDVDLGDTFKDARMALYALLRAYRQEHK